jgi:hypothetical protein
MSKKAKNEKLEMVPASGVATGGLATLIAQPVDKSVLPKTVKKRNLPPLVKPEQVPVGQMLSGKIVAVVPSISGREDMKQSKLLHIEHESGTEFLFPLTGVVKKALGGFDGAEKEVGNKIFIVRQPDGTTEKYGGVKKMFNFDVYTE